MYKKYDIKELAESMEQVIDALFKNPSKEDSKEISNIKGKLNKIKNRQKTTTPNEQENADKIKEQ